MDDYLEQAKERMRKKYLIEALRDDSVQLRIVMDLANEFYPGDVNNQFYLQDISEGQHGCNGGCYY